MAERAGFEPARDLRPYTISSRARSAAPAPLREPWKRDPISVYGPPGAIERVAERVGFEPTVKLPLQRFSRPSPSSTQPSLRELSAV